MGGNSISQSENRSIAAVQRAVQLLRAVAALPPQGRTLTALARKAGIKVPSAHHLLATLVREGVVVKDAALRYHFGPTLHALAETAHRESRLPASVQAELQHLVDLTGENAYLSGWVRGEIQVLEELSGTQAVRVAVPHRGFEYARASGKILLSLLADEELAAFLASTQLEKVTPSTITDPDDLREHLALVRRQGYAVEKGECVEGVACCSAAVMNGELVVAALTISSPLERFLNNEEKLVAAVVECAARASSALGGQPAGRPLTGSPFQIPMDLHSSPTNTEPELPQLPRGKHQWQ